MKKIKQSPSRNFYSRMGHKPSLIVVHCTEGYYPSDLSWLCTPRAEVSAHFYIAPTSEIHQLVDLKYGAWHAGRSVRPTFKHFKKWVNTNRYSVGIEVSIAPNMKHTSQQWQSLKELIKYLSEELSIPIDREHIIGHKEIRSDKTCPGSISVDKLVEDLNKKQVDSGREEIKKQIIELIKKL